jgi:hypothetical protein
MIWKMPDVAAPSYTHRFAARAMLAIVLAGSALRLAYVDRPVDHRLVSPWRQCDYVQIARNYWREEANILYPRIDWRGDTPGYVESEFPLIPWVGARLFDLFGYREWLLRAVSALFGIASLLAFVPLCRKLLPVGGALFATATFALNPLLFHLSTALQPESVMVFGSILAVLLLVRWSERPGFGRLLAAAAAVALAILGKAPAACLGLLFVWVLWQRLGRGLFWNKQVLAAGALAVLPPLAWYAWAAHFWRQYGNSLGVSNGHHALTLGMLWPPVFLLGIVKWETLGLFMPTGWLLALCALRAPRKQSTIPWVWYLSAWIVYIAAAHTTSADWAFYYHSLSVAPGCLLMGAGFQALLEGRVFPWPGVLRPSLPRWAAGVLGAATLGALAVSVVVFVRYRDGRTDLLALRTCARELAHHVPETALIVVQGIGPEFDDRGRPLPFDIPMAFTWMDRKGFSYGTRDFGIKKLEAIASRGGRYWLAYGSDFDSEQFRAEVGKRFRLIARCQDGFSLYDLQKPAAGFSKKP